MRPLATIAALTLGAWIPLAASCGGAEQVDLDGDGGGGDGGGGGGGPCSPAGTECNNCADDDGDDLVDGDDPECIGSKDDDEGSFSTGIPGDNIDSRWQDCFFDGNSGSGDDGCRFHTCCLLGAQSGADCTVDGNFDPATDCPAQTQTCIDFCAPLAPPGCDCFGCCTVCDPETNECRDVLTSPAAAPDCSQEVIGDEALCPSCTKNADCGGGGCEPEGCILCPGQIEEDLPPECNEMNECPGGGTPCDTSADCAGHEYCASSCCVAVVE